MEDEILPVLELLRVADVRPRSATQGNITRAKGHQQSIRSWSSSRRLTVVFDLIVVEVWVGDAGSDFNVCGTNKHCRL